MRIELRARVRAVATGMLAGALALAGVGLTAAPASAAETFDDVPSSHSYYSHITWLAGTGVTSGVGDGSGFAPNASITRGQMAVFLYKMAGSPFFIPPEASPFSDVPTTHTFYTHITWLGETGITSGVGDGSNFAPNATVTRGQMAVFLNKLYGEPQFEPPASSPFSDVATSNTFYRHITWLAETGITSGVGDGSAFAPAAPVSRGQMAVFLFKFSTGLDPYVFIDFLAPDGDGMCQVELTFYNQQFQWEEAYFWWWTYSVPDDDYYFFDIEYVSRPFPYKRVIYVWEGAPAWPGDQISGTYAEVSYGPDIDEITVIRGDDRC